MGTWTARYLPFMYARLRTWICTAKACEQRLAPLLPSFSGLREVILQDRDNLLTHKMKALRYRSAQRSYHDGNKL